MITVRVYDDYNFIGLQDLDTDDLEGFEFSTKFRAKTIEAIRKGYYQNQYTCWF